MSELREKIGIVIATAYQKGLKGEAISCPDMAGELLPLIRSEIERAGLINIYDLPRQLSTGMLWDAMRAQQAHILKIFEGL